MFRAWRTAMHWCEIALAATVLVCGAGTEGLAVVAPPVDAEFNVGAADPRDICEGPDGNIWFTVKAGAAIGRMTPEGGLTYFTLPSPTLGVCAGLDKTIWFTGPNGIGHIS